MLIATSFKIGKKEVKNRIVYQPMEGCDGEKNGSPGELTRRRYSRLASGGAGLIWLEATACMHEGRANPRQLFLHPENIDDFKRLVDDIRETALRTVGFAPLLILQDTHSGRYSKPEGVPAPISAAEASDDYLDTVREKLIATAVLAEKIGVDGVDVKCCHGYLNCELLGCTEKSGKYGGSLENRTRLLRETIEGIKAGCKSDFIVTTRINAVEEICEIAKMLSPELINLTHGNPYVAGQPNRLSTDSPNADSFLFEAQKVQTCVPETAVVASGFSAFAENAGEVAEQWLKKGAFSLVGFGRQIFAYPELARDILNGGLDRSKCCVTCGKCTEIMRAGSTPGCVVRDSKPYLEIYKKAVLKNG